MRRPALNGGKVRHAQHPLAWQGSGKRSAAERHCSWRMLCMLGAAAAANGGSGAAAPLPRRRCPRFRKVTG